MTEQNPPPGWYPSPHDPAHLDRYWNGVEWSQQVRVGEEPGLMVQLRSLPLWVMVVIPAFVVTAVLMSHVEVPHGPVRTARQAVLAFKRYEVHKGIREPLHLVKCKPGQEAFSCTGAEHQSRKVLSGGDLTAIIAPSGRVTPVVLAVDPDNQLAQPNLRGRNRG